MKNPYLMSMAFSHEVYSNEDTEYVSYVPSKNPYLCHGWLKDAASKLKQKAYNNKYYQKNKELWKTKYYKYEKKGRQAAEDVKSAFSNFSKSAGKYGSNVKKALTSGPAHNFTDKTDSKPHNYDPLTEYVADSFGNKHQYKLIKNTVLGTAGIVGGIATIGVGVVTANPLAVAGGVAMTAIGVSNSISAGKTIVEAVKAEQKAAEIEKRKKTEPVDPKSGFHLNTQNLSDEENLQAVNAKYKNLDYGTKNNCMLCSVTYEMRRRGYDVTANSADWGYTNLDVKRWFPDAQPEAIPVSPTMSDDFRNKCLAQGEGASGLVLVSWKKELGGSGHAMHYRVENGQVIISDGQVGKEYGDISKLTPYISEISYCRLDDKEPDYKALKEVCK